MAYPSCISTCITEYFNPGNGQDYITYNNIFKDLGLCYSDGCCGDDTVFDDKVGTCVGKISENTGAPMSSSPVGGSGSATPVAAYSDESASPVSGDADPSASADPVDTADPSATPVSGDVEPIPTPVSGDAEAFTTLTTLPTFIQGENSQGYNTESTYGTPVKIDPPVSPGQFDMKTASFEEKKDYYKNQISNDFAKFIPENAIPDLSNGDPSGQQAENDTSEVVNNMNNSTSETLGNFSGDGSVKCHFTTMSDCVENKNSQNRVVYQPFNESDLLPKTQILDHTIFYKGIDNGEQLTEKFGKYN